MTLNPSYPLFSNMKGVYVFTSHIECACVSGMVFLGIAMNLDMRLCLSLFDGLSSLPDQSLQS